MGIRETLNARPQVTTAVTGAIVLLALIFIVYQLFSGGGRGPGISGTPKAFFSDDDGATYFVDDATKETPFDHNGKQAYGVVVFRCEAAGKPFVAFLKKLSEQQKSQLAAAKNDSSSPGAVALISMAGPPDVKKPGSAKWVSVGQPGYDQITRPVCPDNPSSRVFPVNIGEPNSGAVGG